MTEVFQGRNFNKHTSPTQTEAVAEVSILGTHIWKLILELRRYDKVDYWRKQRRIPQTVL